MNSNPPMGADELLRRAKKAIAAAPAGTRTRVIHLQMFKLCLTPVANANGADVVGFLGLTPAYITEWQKMKNLAEDFADLLVR